MQIQKKQIWRFFFYLVKAKGNVRTFKVHKRLCDFRAKLLRSFNTNNNKSLKNSRLKIELKKTEKKVDNLHTDSYPNPDHWPDDKKGMIETTEITLQVHAYLKWKLNSCILDKIRNSVWISIFNLTLISSFTSRVNNF